MWDTPELKERLGAIARRRRPSFAPVAAEDDAANGATVEGGRGPGRRQRLYRDVIETQVPGAMLGVEAYLPGGEWRDARGAVFVHERLRSTMEEPSPDWGTLGQPSEDEEDLAALAYHGLGAALFLDLETGGFASSPVFLAGTMHWNGSDFVLRQYFARHYGEEAALVRALAEQARGFEFLVTFNGKSYDAPFLTNRAYVHGENLHLPPRHVDLLHPARRRWKRTLDNCRLQTLERWVCRRHRAGDVPSDEVPALYHDYVRRGDPYRLVPVFHHNLLDVITMGEVLAALCKKRRPKREREVGTFELEPVEEPMLPFGDDAPIVPFAEY